MFEALVIPMPTDSGTFRVFGDKCFGDPHVRDVEPLRNLSSGAMKRRRKGWSWNKPVFSKVIPPAESDHAPLCRIFSQSSVFKREICYPCDDVSFFFFRKKGGTIHEPVWE